MNARTCVARIFTAVLIGTTIGITTPSGIAETVPASDAKNHWAFKKPVEPPVPAAKNSVWIKNPIDAFILAKLEEKGLKPAPPADRRTLIRRAYFDLIGLPPTPEEVEAFVADGSPDAFAKVVEQLLADPRYGERWGRYWLDVARYADSKGYVFQEERKYPYAYTYRDYVIRSFNEDKPYDRFLIEQIAADRLPLGDDKRPLAAMGFLTLGRRFLNRLPDIVDDRMDVVCRGTMAITIGCARCHNHKFDPIPTADYYSLYSIFANSPDAKTPPLIGEPEHTPEYEAFLKEQQKRQTAIDQFLAGKYPLVVAPLRSAKVITDYLLSTQLEKIDVKAYLAGTGVSPYMAERWKAYLKRQADKNDPVFVAWRAYAAIPEKDFAARSAAVTDELAQVDPKRPINALVRKTFTGPPPGSMLEVAERYGDLLSKFDKPDPLAAGPEETLRQVLRGEDSPTNVPMADVTKLLKGAVSMELKKLRGRLDALNATSPAAPPRAMTLEEAPTIQPQHVFVRGSEGNWGPEVKPHFLTCLSGDDPKSFTQGSGRLELAQAVGSKDNPLTARVMVNRVWLHHFGFGIVRTPSDFGTRSDPPTHPELLDYLAVHFMQEGWSIKALQRRIMLSSAYQLSADVSPDAARLDGQNLLLSHFNRQRLDFESMRDSLLFVAGTLDPKMYGRPVDLAADPKSARRTIYAFIDRQNLSPLFRSFDFASPDATCPRRFNTTVPQQALFMLNSPFFLEQAKSVLQRPQIAAENDPQKKISQLYRLLFNRTPAREELALGTSFLQSEEAQPGESAIWQYGCGQYDSASHRTENFTPFAHFTGDSWQPGKVLPDPQFVYAVLTPGGGHPGKDLQHAVIRRWVSPVEGSVSIDGVIIHPDTHGDGIRARIISSRSGELGSWTVAHGQAQASLKGVAVKLGDTIDFIVDCFGDDSYDSFSWAPILRWEPTASSGQGDAPRVWNATTDFGGLEKSQKSLSPWEKYVQVLLESNEFVFVD